MINTTLGCARAKKNRDLACDTIEDMFHHKTLKPFCTGYLMVYCR